MMSFCAKNKITGEIVNALQIGNDAKYQFPENEEWISDGEGIENWEEIVKKYGEITCIFVKEKTVINYQGTKFWSRPHFRIPNAKKLGINYTPESIEHKFAKNWICENYSKIKIHSATQNGLPVNSVWLKDLADMSKICFGSYEFENLQEVRVRTVKTRIADVIFFFQKKNEIYGDGIVFEIQLSNQQERVFEERTLDWIVKGFSVAWLYYSDFDFEKGVLKNDDVKVISWLEGLKGFKRNFGKDIKLLVQEELRKINYELNSLKKKIDEYFVDDNNIELCKLKARITTIEERILIDKIPRCDKCNLYMQVRRKGNDRFWGCPNWQNCHSKTKPYLND